MVRISALFRRLCRLFQYFTLEFCFKSEPNPNRLKTLPTFAGVEYTPISLTAPPHRRRLEKKEHRISWPPGKPRKPSPRPLRPPPTSTSSAGSRRWQTYASPPAFTGWTAPSRSTTRLCAELVVAGTFIKLSEEKWPGCFYAPLQPPNDVARVEDRTYHLFPLQGKRRPHQQLGRPIRHAQEAQAAVQGLECAAAPCTSCPSPWVQSARPWHRSASSSPIPPMP